MSGHVEAEAAGCWFLGIPSRTEESWSPRELWTQQYAFLWIPCHLFLAGKEDLKFPLPLGFWLGSLKRSVTSLKCILLDRLVFQAVPLLELFKIFLRINPSFLLFLFCWGFFSCVFWQLQDKSLPRWTPQHKCSYCVSQRSMEYSASDRVQRYKSLAAPPAFGNHPGGRCQWER